MSESEYQMLCGLIEAQFENAVKELRETYQQHLQAIQNFWTLGQQPQAKSDNAGKLPFRKQHGGLIEGVRRAAFQLGQGFTLQDIEDVLRAEQPLLTISSSRKSISTALRRLYEDRQLVLVDKGRGTRPAKYSVASFNGGIAGREDAMHTVSGMQA